MEKVLNKCPLCGSKIEYSALMQYTNVYGILRNGKISKNRIRKEDSGSMECGFISCTNSECDFVTNCELEAEMHNEIDIYQVGRAFMYEMND